MSKPISEILDGADLNQDLHYLIGYVWAEGNQKREFPSSHMSELAAHVLAKYPLPDTQDQGWRDIESAPKDGTEILAVGNNFGDRAKGQHFAVVCWSGDCWCDDGLGGINDLQYLTHWKPLPSPPEGE